MTQKELKELFAYDSETGDFTRIKATSNSVKVGEVINSKDAYGYIHTRIKGNRYKVHRLIWLYVHGKFPKHQIDHINHIRDDNRICNLREVTHQENAKNVSMNCNNTSGTVGVRFNKGMNKWVSRIMLNQRALWLGCFDSKEDAIKVRKEAEIKYGFHKNHGQRK